MLNTGVGHSPSTSFSLLLIWVINFKLERTSQDEETEKNVVRSLEEGGSGEGEGGEVEMVVISTVDDPGSGEEDNVDQSIPDPKPVEDARESKPTKLNLQQKMRQ